MSAARWLSLVVAGVYLSVWAMASISAGRAITNPDSIPPSRQPMLDLMLRGLVLRGRDTRLQRALALPSATLAWPTTLDSAEFLSRKSDRSHAALRVLRPRTLRIGYTMLALSLVTMLAYQQGLVFDRVAGTVSAIIVIASVSRLASFVVVPLPTLVRRSRGRPYLNFLAVAVVDAGTLLTSCTVFRSQVTSRDIDGDSLQSTMRDLFNVPGNMLGLFELGRLDAGLAAIGAVYAAALARALLSFEEFRRTDEDLLELAFAEQQMGNSLAADAWLDQLRDRNSTLAYWMRAGLSMAQGQFRRALQLQRQCFAASGEHVSEARVWSSLGFLAIHSGMTDERIEQFSRFVIQQAGDIECASAIADIVPLHSLQQPFIEGLLPQMEGRPITCAVLLVGLGRPSEARQTLLTVDTTDPFATVFVLTWLGLAELHIGNSIDDHGWLDRWQERSLPRVRRATDELPVDQMDMAAKLLVILELALDSVAEPPVGQWPKLTRDSARLLQRELATIADQLAESPNQLQRFRKVSRQAARRLAAPENEAR